MTEACHTIKLSARDQRQQPIVRVIGVGSAHGADQVGWLACESLQTVSDAHQFDWQLCRTPVQLPQLIQDCDAIIIIDTSLNAGQDGRVISLTWPIPHHHYHSLCSSHAFNVLEALQLAATLGELPSQTYVLAVTVTHPDHDATTVVTNALPQLQRELNRIAASINANSPLDG